MLATRWCAIGWVATLGMVAARTSVAATSALMAMFDTNSDGQVSLAEYQTYMDRGFQRMDVNGDAIVEPGEWPAGTRRDASLTLAAHRHHVARQFHRQDANHDGHLDVRELMAPPH